MTTDRTDVPVALMTTDQAAKYLGRTAGSLKVSRVKGINTPPFIKDGRSVRYRLSDLEAFVAARVRTSTSDVSRAA